MSILRAPSVARPLEAHPTLVHKGPMRTEVITTPLFGFRVGELTTSWI